VCVLAALGCRQEEQHAAAPAGLALREGPSAACQLPGAALLRRRRSRSPSQPHRRARAEAETWIATRPTTVPLPLGDPDVVVVRGREHLQSAADRPRALPDRSSCSRSSATRSASSALRRSALHGGESKRRSNIEPCSARS
jgi:hypothetical protein